MSLFLIYSFTVTCAGIRSILTKQNGRIEGIGALFNFFRAAVALLLFLLLALINGFSFHFPTLLYATLYGLLFVGSCFCGLRAMALGPMGMTSTIVSFSLVIPCLFGAFFLNERIRAIDLIGFFLIAVAILMMNIRKKESSLTPKSRKSVWGLYLSGTVLCDGVRSVIQTLHQKSTPTLYRYEFMCVAMLVGSLIFALALWKKRHLLTTNSSTKLYKCAAYGAGAGIANGTYNYLVLYLAATENATALFPILSVATIVVNLLSGRLIFKERLSLIKRIGVCLALVAIFLIKI